MDGILLHVKPLQSHRRAMVLAIGMVGTTMLFAQQDSSLTRMFEGLSAKERSRIAKQEQEEAAKDAKYQAMMEQGDALFREQRYEEALRIYQEARVMRPYNAYTKVRIQDLQALIARKEAEQAAMEAPKEAAEPPPVPIPAEVPVQMQEPPMDTVPSPKPPAPPLEQQSEPRIDRARIVVPPKPERTEPLQPRQEKPAAEPWPDGVQERMFKEGRSVVVERIVIEEGRSTIYRKVMHPWGGAAYFKDAITISERAWDEVFGR